MPRLKAGILLPCLERIFRRASVTEIQLSRVSRRCLTSKGHSASRTPRTIVRPAIVHLPFELLLLNASFVGHCEVSLATFALALALAFTASVHRESHELVLSAPHHEMVGQSVALTSALDSIQRLIRRLVFVVTPLSRFAMLLAIKAMLLGGVIGTFSSMSTIASLAYSDLLEIWVVRA